VKRLTIAMTDELYLELLKFNTDECKKEVRKLSLGNSIRGLISSRLEQLGYHDGSGSFPAPYLGERSPTARRNTDK